MHEQQIIAADQAPAQIGIRLRLEDRRVDAVADHAWRCVELEDRSRLLGEPGRDGRDRGAAAEIRGEHLPRPCAATPGRDVGPVEGGDHRNIERLHRPQRASQQIRRVVDVEAVEPLRGAHLPQTYARPVERRAQRRPRRRAQRQPVQGDRPVLRVRQPSGEHLWLGAVEEVDVVPRVGQPRRDLDGDLRAAAEPAETDDSDPQAAARRPRARVP